MFLMEVRCCCKPKRLIGWLSLPCMIRQECDIKITTDSGRSELLEIRHCTVMLGLPKIQSVPLGSTVELADAGGTKTLVCRSLAIKSNDRPDEFWKMLPGFIPKEAADFPLSLPQDYSPCSFP